MADKREQCKSCKIGCSENIFQIKLNQSRIPFDKCFDYVPKQTNADKIRSMTDEELAEFFNKFDNICGMCSKNIGCFIVDTDRCKNNILEWLQSEAE